MKNKNFMPVNVNLIKHNLINLWQLVFEVTDSCNLNCKYCAYSDFYGGYDERKNEQLSFNKAKLIIDYLVELWQSETVDSFIMPFAVGFYGGEPLLNVKFIKDVIDYFENLGKLNKKIRYNITTNAILLDKHMDFLVEKDFDILISLDGDEQGQSYRVDKRGQNSFSKVMKNIKMFKNRHPDYFNSPRVAFNSVLHNKNNIEGILSFFKDNFSKQPSIATLNDAGINVDKVTEFWKTYKNIAFSIKESNNCDALKEELFIKDPDTSLLMNYIFHDTKNVYNSYVDLLF